MIQEARARKLALKSKKKLSEAEDMMGGDYGREVTECIFGKQLK